MPAALLAETLSNVRSRHACAEWPARFTGLDQPGLYAWWVDQAGADIISTQLGARVAPGMIYVGQAGARNSTATLRSRLGQNHLNGKIGRSTLRLTVAAILFDDICSRMTGDCRLDHEGEAMVSKWMRAHLSLTVAAFADRTALTKVEFDVLDLLDPPLNLQHMPATMLRLTLKGRRSRIRLAPRTTDVEARPKRKPTYKPAQPTQTRLRTGITLHEEISSILLEHGKPWLTTREIATHANTRGRYIKRDGTPITDFQVHGRTQNYSRLFERSGSRVRLRTD